MARLTLRRALPEDAAAAARVLVASITALCGPDHRGDPAEIAAWTANKTPAAVGAMIAGGGVWVAVRDREIIGVAAANLARAQITLLYVSPKARRTGESTALLERLEHTLAAAGIEVARLETTVTARGFYLARGWRSESGTTGRMLVKRLTS